MRAVRRGMAAILPEEIIVLSSWEVPSFGSFHLLPLFTDLSLFFHLPGAAIVGVRRCLFRHQPAEAEHPLQRRAFSARPPRAMCARFPPTSLLKERNLVTPPLLTFRFLSPSPLVFCCADFWRVLETMQIEDRQAFLRFVWGRSRLPSRDSGSSSSSSSFFLDACVRACVR